MISRGRVKPYLTHFHPVTIDGINKTVSACPRRERSTVRVKIQADSIRTNLLVAGSRLSDVSYSGISIQSSL